MNIGPQEVLLILVLALLIFGPRRLPDIARQIGKAVREVRKVSSEFEREVKTSFALDEHHSTYVTPKKREPDGNGTTERSESTRTEDGNGDTDRSEATRTTEPDDPVGAEDPPQEQPGPETDRPDPTP